MLTCHATEASINPTWIYGAQLSQLEANGQTFLSPHQTRHSPLQMTIFTERYKCEQLTSAISSIDFTSDKKGDVNKVHGIYYRGIQSKAFSFVKEYRD